LRSRSWRWLLEKELRELSASRSYWLLLLVVGALVGRAFITSVNLYAEASGISGGPAALSQGLSPLEGIIVPTLGAYDLAATLLFPFVVIRLVASEKQTGALALMLQVPVSFDSIVAVKGVALVIAWLVAGLAGAAALLLWRGMGGHVYAPEMWAVVLGHILRGVLTIGVGAAAGALAASAASAAIVALTITLGTWALDYVAAARGGALASIAAYTPSAALRVFEHGELRVATVLILLTLGLGGLAVAAIWLQEGRRVVVRASRFLGVVATVALLCVVFARIRTSFDVSEDRRNSFPPADEAALRRIVQPLQITVYLAAEDPRLADLERGTFAKLRRTMHDVQIDYAAKSRSGLFERPNEHYGEVWYELGGKREMTRSTTEPIILETIYALVGRAPPTPINEPPYPGYPLAARPASAAWVFFLVWPVCIIAAWWWLRRPAIRRLQPA
jgi:ABC-type transport system involved in multi-copper enzyme maturation permease subunit